MRYRLSCGSRVNLEHMRVAQIWDILARHTVADLDYMPHMYRNVLRVQKSVTLNQARGCFGFSGDANIGKVAVPAVQAAPAFSSSFATPLRGAADMWCLIPQAIDQVSTCTMSHEDFLRTS